MYRRGRHRRGRRWRSRSWPRPPPRMPRMPPRVPARPRRGQRRARCTTAAHPGPPRPTRSGRAGRAREPYRGAHLACSWPGACARGAPPQTSETSAAFCRCRGRKHRVCGATHNMAGTMAAGFAAAGHFSARCGSKAVGAPGSSALGGRSWMDCAHVFRELNLSM